MWLAGVEKDVGAVDRGILYLSTDAGTSWTELLRESSYTKVKIKEDSLGNIYLLVDGVIRVSSDNGVSWTEIMDASFGARDLIIDGNDNIFALTNGNELLRYSALGPIFWIVEEDELDAVGLLVGIFDYESGYLSGYMTLVDSTKIGILGVNYEQAEGVVNYVRIYDTN